MGLDFAFIAAQTSLFDTPDRPYSVPLPSTLLQDITQLLAHEAGVEQWSEWLVRYIPHLFNPFIRLTIHTI